MALSVPHFSLILESEPLSSGSANGRVCHQLRLALDKAKVRLANPCQLCIGLLIRVLHPARSQSTGEVGSGRLASESGPEVGSKSNDVVIDHPSCPKVGSEVGGSSLCWPAEEEVGRYRLLVGDSSPGLILSVESRNTDFYWQTLVLDLGPRATPLAVPTGQAWPRPPVRVHGLLGTIEGRVCWVQHQHVLWSGFPPGLPSPFHLALSLPVSSLFS